MNLPWCWPARGRPAAYSGVGRGSRPVDIRTPVRRTPSGSAWASPAMRHSISIYPDNLESLDAAGRSWSPSRRWTMRALPADLDGLYFGGGYPEVHAERLAANGPMRDAVRRFAASGRPVYAECGGLMYLGRSLQDARRPRFPMAGMLPVDTTMLEAQNAGLCRSHFAADSLWGRGGEACRGHEFHYSEIVADGSRARAGSRPITCGTAAASGRRRRVLPRGACWPATSTCTGPRGRGPSSTFWPVARNRS